jgi:hypothetical protein
MLLEVNPMRRLLSTALVLLGSGIAPAADFPAFEAREIDPRIGNVCYAVTAADVNNDGNLDVVAISEDAVVWYENPSWKKHDIIRGATARDNVCIQPHDIDGDGRVDFALGAGWRPPDTKNPSTLQWLGRDRDGKWESHPIRYEEPTLHRFRWADVNGTGRPQLVVAPLQGRGTKGPNWGEGQGVRVQVFEVPEDPTRPDWPVETADESLHTIHNLWPVAFDTDPAQELLLAAWEGVFLIDRDESGKWTRTRLGTGNQDAQPFKGASEIKLGRLGGGLAYIATIEPWHGHQVVVYTPRRGDPAFLPDVGEPWHRRVIAEPVQWGHAVWTADLDDDPDEELIIGQRDPNRQGDGPKGPGVFVFDPRRTADGLTFARSTIDDGGMACEDALAADLDGDGRIDIIAGGRATHNVKIYWNKGASK